MSSLAATKKDYIQNLLHPEEITELFEAMQSLSHPFLPKNNATKISISCYVGWIKLLHYLFLTVVLLNKILHQLLCWLDKTLALFILTVVLLNKILHVVRLDKTSINYFFKNELYFSCRLRTGNNYPEIAGFTSYT